MPAMGKIYGRVLDAGTKKPAEYATITIRSVRNDSLLGGTIVRSNGDFTVEKLPFGTFKVVVSFIGYTPLEQEATIGRDRMEVDLGNLMLAPDAELLNEVEIQGERSQVVMKVDRRVFNVERDLSTRGGTGVDVMKNVPGLNVDVEGNVELRGSSPQILVDGRPSALTLEQIPAEDIERVEVITNPSVVFDASATGGIINVVLKKNTKPGYFGQVQGGIGTNDRYQASGNLNVKEGRTSFNIGLNYNTSQNETDGRTRRTDLVEGVPSSRFEQDALNESYWTMFGGRFGVEHELSNRNTISLSTNVMSRRMGGDETQAFRTVTGDGEPLSSGDQFNESLNEHLSVNNQVMLRRRSPKEGKEWTLDLNHSYWERNSRSAFTTRSFGTDEAPLEWSPRTQENLGGAGYNRWRLQFDAINPLEDGARIEWGAMASYTLDNTWLYVFLSSPQIGESVADTNQSNNYMITDIVNAAYFNYARKLNDRWSMQAGVRLEQTLFDAELLGRDLTLGYRYPDGTKDLDKTFFPALYLVRRWEGSNREFQVNFSRKIRRPRFWQIMPFIQIADSRNIRIGNPALAPELQNVAEINHLLPVQQGKGSWLSSLYGRYVQDIISHVAFPLESDPDILVNSWDNGRNAFEYGWENTLRIEPVRKLVTTLSGTIQYVNVELGGRFPVRNSGFNWDTKLIVSYEMEKDWLLQVNGSYNAPSIIPQGTRISNYGVDASIAKEFNKQWSAVLSVNDVFFTRRWGYSYDTPTFIQDDFRRREMRFVRLTVTWKFGERDASFFRRRPQTGTEPSLRGGGGQEE